MRIGLLGKKIGTSTRNDLRKEPTVDYWKKAPQSL